MPIFPFEKEILQALNGIVSKNDRFDQVLLYITDSHLLKGGVLAMLYWSLWFNGSVNDKKETIKKGILFSMIGCFIAVFFTRILVHIAPYRPRPFFNKELALAIPSKLDTAIFDDLNSFPSDHATLFIALSYGLLKINKKIGVWAFCYVLLFILLPRMSMGLHYPTDILAGALIGIVCIELAFTLNVMKNWNKGIFGIEKNRPELFYPLFFLFTYQIANLFDDTRQLISFLSHILKG